MEYATGFEPMCVPKHHDPCRNHPLRPLGHAHLTNTSLIGKPLPKLTQNSQTLTYAVAVRFMVEDLNGGKCSTPYHFLRSRGGSMYF